MAPETKAPAGCGDNYFATTHWSVVLAARDAESTTRALESLCRTYWQPVYAFVRRKGHSPEDAKDLTQSFFARFVEKNFLATVGPEKGRFRSFLLATVKNFLLNEWRRENTAKRGSHYSFISWDEAEAACQVKSETFAALSPDAAFDRQWAVTLVSQVLARLEKECGDVGKQGLFAVLRVYLAGETTLSHADAGARLGMTSEAVQVAVHRLRRRYGELLRAEISQIVSRPEEIDEEIRYLFTAMRS